MTQNDVGGRLVAALLGGLTVACACAFLLAANAGVADSRSWGIGLMAGIMASVAVGSATLLVTALSERDEKPSDPEEATKCDDSRSA